MGVIQLRCLGQNGRFGNQLTEYAVVRHFAEKYGHTLQIPWDWQGRRIFEGVDHPPIDESLNLPGARDTDLVCEPQRWKKGNIVAYGYFQDIDFLNKLSRSQCKKWFKIRRWIVNRCPPRKGFYVAAHLRRGDTTLPHVENRVINQSSVEAAIRQFGYDMKDVVWVSDGISHKAVYEYRENYWDFIGDFLTLIRAPVLFRSNSTFAYWASVLQKNGKVYSPFVPSDSPKWTDVTYEEGLNLSYFGDQRGSMLP